MEFLNTIQDLKNKLTSLTKDSIQTLESITHLIKGSLLDKYTYKHGKKQSREFSVTSDLQHFQWKPENSSRKVRKFLLNEILEVTAGNSEFACRTQQEMRLDPESVCFTVHLKDRPVNIVAPSQKIRDFWVFGLKLLLKHEKIDRLEELSQLDTLININIQKARQEMNDQDRSILKSSESLPVEDSEIAKLQKKLKDIEKANARLQRQLVEMNSKADKEYEVEGVLKKEIKSKEKSEKKLQSQIELLNLQFENLEKEYTQKILTSEEKLNQKDSKLLEVQAEFDEFKKQIKESFNRSLVQKVQQYRESKEILCSYVNYLKERLETIEKEVALWQAVVHTHVLPIYQSKKTGKTPSFKQVLEFALDTMERKLVTDRSQSQFISLLTEAKKNVKS
jgi:hypothetical protein